MIFKKKEKTSFIRDDELSEDSLGSKKSFFSKIFKKKKEEKEELGPDSVNSGLNVNSDSMINNNINNTSSDMVNTSLTDMYNSGGSDSSSLVDISQNDDVKPIDTSNTINNIPTTKVKIKDNIKRNKRSGGVTLIDRLFDIILVAILVFVLIHYVPRVMNYWKSGRVKYAKMATEMGTEIKKYYEQKDQKCTTDTDKKYFFNIYDSTERFGSDYKSPFLKNKIKGYIEIDDNGKSADYYIYVNDGLFGISGVKLEDIDAGDVGIFTDLTLEHPKAMECKLKFELRE